MKTTDIASLIHNRRIELGISLEKIGKACGVHRSTVQRWEIGRCKDIKMSHIETLSRVLHLPKEVFVGSKKEIVIEKAELVLLKEEIINLLNAVQDENKLQDIKKYIKYFGF